MCAVVASHRSHPLTYVEVPRASLDDLLRECARRIMSDDFLLRAGRRLFSEYMVIRAISRSMFGWLFADDGCPAFFA